LLGLDELGAGVETQERLREELTNQYEGAEVD
jgi:hypothetical protein